MSENNSNLSSIQSAVSESVAGGGDIRSQVRDLTLRALKGRHLDAEAVKQVVKAVGEGVNLGLERRGGEIRLALSEAVAGVDEALAKSAEAIRLALQQLTSQSRDFTAVDLRLALDDLKRLEKEFLSTLGDAAEVTGGKVRQEFRDLADHARRAGTDTGAKVSATVSEFENRLRAVAAEGTVAGKAGAREMSARLAALASGILAGLADALHEKSEKLK